MDLFSTFTIDIIPNKLIWSVRNEETVTIKHIPKSADTIAFINDKTLVYTAFFADFGPFDLGLVHKFCQQLHDTMLKAKESQKKVVYYTSNNPHNKANCAVLLCAYMIFVLNASVEQAYSPFIGMVPQFVPFRDAGFCINTFPINVLDCAQAMRRAKSLGHFNYKTFSTSTFQNLAKLQNGDISWIIPNKFIAFSGPITKRRQVSPGVFTLTPEEYVPLMKGLGVTCIIRFNSKCYDRSVFLNNGIRHVDLFYEDGGNPTEAIVQAFLQICEHERGAIAVHCKAGLGRTGTNIAAFMMKHYGYTAKETIAWCRLCRPGCVVGPQQQYLATIEAKMYAEGDLYRERNNIKPIVAEPSSTAQEHQRSVNGQSPMFDGRVHTPPLFNNARDNYAANMKQPVESLFQRSVANSNLNSNGAYRNGASGSGSPVSVQQRHSDDSQDQQSASKSAFNLNVYAPQQQSRNGSSNARPATSSGVTTKKVTYDQNVSYSNGSSNAATYSGSNYSGSGSPVSSSRLLSASTASQRLQQGYGLSNSQQGQGHGAGSPPVAVKSNGYFSSSPENNNASSFQTPVKSATAQQQQQQQQSGRTTHYFTDTRDSHRQQQSPDGKLLVAVSPNNGSRPATSAINLNSSPMSTSKVYAGSTNSARRSASVNRSVNFASGTSGGKLSSSIDFDRQPRASPTLGSGGSGSPVRHSSAQRSRVNPSQEYAQNYAASTSPLSRPRTSGGSSMRI